jgi:Ricin-type beta-trefoil lectin domain
MKLSMQSHPIVSNINTALKSKLALVVGSTMLSVAISTTLTDSSAQAGSAGTVQSQVTGRCLDGNRSERIYTSECNGGSYQSWNIYQIGSNWVLKSNGTALCLDSNEKKEVYAKDCKQDNPYQRWVFSSSEGGKYKNEATGLCLDSNNKGEVYTLGCTEKSTGQKWHS